MHAVRTLPTVVAAAALLISCGSGDGSSEVSSTTLEPTSTTSAATSTTAAVPATTTVMTTTTATTTTAESAPTTTEVVGLGQPAIWPAADVVFNTPEEAAADFVANALGVAPVLGEFQQGDSRSGEIEVLSPGEGDSAVVVKRGLLLLRQLGPDDGWFVIAAVNDEASITTPESGAAVDSAPLTVEGVGHGFEATIVVSAFVAGDAHRMLDRQVAQAGTMEAAGPFSVVLDLTGASPGDVITLLVQGGTGLETDPGEFGAIPVVIAG